MWNNNRKETSRAQNMNSSKLELYSNIKAIYRREYYIDNLKDIAIRKRITQLRISAHKLPIERGRYTNTPREQRVCEMCNTRAIGDEFHYLLVCTEISFVALRDAFLNDIQNINTNFTNFDKKSLFYYIMSLNDSSIFSASVKFIYGIMETYYSK